MTDPRGPEETLQTRDWYSPREFTAEYEWEPKETRGEFWWTVPLAEFGDESDETGKSWPRWWYESELREHGLPLDGSWPVEVSDPFDGLPALLLPITDIATDLIARADQWRREYRVPRDRCAPWV
jgi:hypothetical protein